MAFTVKLVECYPGFGPELTTDGNMETETVPATDWPEGGGAGADANIATVRSGCQSLLVTSVAAGGYASQTITVEAGHKYKIDVWGYSTAAGDTWCVRIYIGANVVWTSATHDVLGIVAWDKETKFYRVPTGVTAIILRLEVVGAGKHVHFDDVSVKREPPVPMTEIPLFYSATHWAMLEKGLEPNDPERRELWGGYLEDQLVRQEDGKRVIPLKLQGSWTTTDDLIDGVNALEEMLRHAARFRKDGWGGECFLEFKLHSATYGIWYPVCSGSILKSDLMNACASIMESENRVTKTLVEVPITIICEACWESPFTYDLANLLDNPGFEEWNGTGGTCPLCNCEPDCWVDCSMAGAAGSNNQETDTVKEGCKALRIEIDTPAAGTYQGVTQDIDTRLRADTEYTLLVWVQNELIANGKIQVYPEGSSSGIVNYAIDAATAHVAYTLHHCHFTPNATDLSGGANWYHIRALIIDDGSGTCVGIAHIDKMLVMESSMGTPDTADVPTGWMSSGNLMNHYDRTAGHINFLSVCDVPGEVEAEARYYIDTADEIAYMRLAKRTRDNPCNFIWQLLPLNAVVDILDTTIVAEPTAPGAFMVQTTFVTSQAMSLRCHWDISTNLASYYGKYALLMVAKMSGAANTASLQVDCYDGNNSSGRIITKTVSGTSWKLKDGWEVLSFRIGTADDDLFAAGNTWIIRLWASTDGAPGDQLHVACAYLVSLDEAFSISGIGAALPATIDWILKDMDGDRGFFAYSTATNRYYPNIGVVGSYPLLEPEVENWLYFAVSNTLEVWTYDDAFSVALTYRPRGIFLRGTNPG